MSDKMRARTERIAEMFEGGKKFTEELMQENERLRLVNERLKADIRDVEDERIIDVPNLKERLKLADEENSILRDELKDMKKQYNTIENENWDFSERYLHVEQQNTSLLNLYVATQRLHSTLDFFEALEIVKEIIVNLVGSDVFEIVLYDSDAQRLLPLALEGPFATITNDESMCLIIADTLRSGTVHVLDLEERTTSDHEPAACIPLKIGDEVLGMVIVRELLSQKSGFDGVDYELFELIGEHAATVLLASYWFSTSDVLENEASRSKLFRRIAERAAAGSEHP